jgi:hypothetical protein
MDLGSPALCKNRVKLLILKGQTNESRMVVFRIFYRTLRPRSPDAMVLTAVLELCVFFHVPHSPAYFNPNLNCLGHQKSQVSPKNPRCFLVLVLLGSFWALLCSCYFLNIYPLNV